jgi:uncharacterized protein (DUF362 family)
MAVDEGRRRFLKSLTVIPVAGGLAALGLRAAFPGPPPSKASAPSRPVVASFRKEGLLDAKGGMDPAKLEEILGPALSRATGEETAAGAMRSLFRPADVVGIKVNCIAGRGLSPDPVLVKRLCEYLQEAGVPARNIVIWDRTDRELASAGFTVARSGSSVRCMGTENDYERTPREWGPGGSCFAGILVSDLTALINVGVLKDHDLAGVSIGLKNWYGAIHNPNKHHADGCAPYIPHLAATPLIHDKLRLTVIDASTIQIHGGPARNPKWGRKWNGVLASVDPVAVDAVGWGLIESHRKEAGLRTLAQEKREPVWIAGAGRLGLGQADPSKIEVAAG